MSGSEAVQKDKLMTAAAFFMAFLLGGENLDGWIVNAGQWENVNGAMVCRAAPASIRSAYESDAFALRFRYRRSGAGTNRLALHSRMSTGGTVLLLTPGGLFPADAAEPPRDPRPPDDWIEAHVHVRDGQLRVVSQQSPTNTLHAAIVPVPAGARGFLRFEATEPGLEIRDLTVTEPGFVPMFDGKTLDGWEIMYPKDPADPGWVIDDGVVRCRGRRSGWLRTWRTYDDFVLRLEYQLEPRGNSGVYVRAPIEGRVSRNGFEVQLLDDVPHRDEIKRAQQAGSIYDGIAPEAQVPAPVNQWNSLEILCDGQRVRTVLNGIQLYDARLDEAARDINSDLRPLATRRSVGFIGLQDHSSPVLFRNVRIRALN